MRFRRRRSFRRKPAMSYPTWNRVASCTTVNLDPFATGTDVSICNTKIANGVVLFDNKGVVTTGDQKFVMERLRIARTIEAHVNVTQTGSIPRMVMGSIYCACSLETSLALVGGSVSFSTAVLDTQFGLDILGVEMRCWHWAQGGISGLHPLIGTRYDSVSDNTDIKVKRKLQNNQLIFQLNWFAFEAMTALSNVILRENAAFSVLTRHQT